MYEGPLPTGVFTLS